MHDAMPHHHHAGIEAAAGKKSGSGIAEILRNRFWEFFMLFLAVTAGFLADSYREHRNDRKSGELYLEAVVDDLKNDTALIAESIASIRMKMPYFDSVLLFLKNPGQYGYQLPQRIYMPTYAEHIYYPVQATYQQLKFTGKLRLIPDLKVLDSLMNYHENVLGDIKNHMGYVRDYYKRYIQQQELYFDLEPFNEYLNGILQGRRENGSSSNMLTLINRDPKQLASLRNLVVSTKAFEVQYIRMLHRLHGDAGRLIRFIREKRPQTKA